MRHEYQAKMPEVAEKIQFYIGDVRDLQSRKICYAMEWITYFMQQR